ncbi:MAG: L-2-hydroxyglutarate oxidase [Bacteroidales bacterium]|nr:L-2-hydroxyglutarate oxidase [Bacteroidales bacterium]
MNFDVIIIGGGIVGLATALKTKELNPSLKICILEKEKEVASHQTGNNSGVIHSGIYYKPGSLKADNCIRGYKYLVDFCEANNIPFEINGKIIVATDTKELPGLENLYERGIANGLTRIKRLRKEEIVEYEPHVAGISGIHVPYTGIVDYKLVSLKMAEIFKEKYSGEIFTSNEVLDIISGPEGVKIETNERVFTTRQFVNTAGLFSDRIAKFSIDKPGLKIIPFRGEYYKLRPEKEYLVKNLVYPVPDPNFPFLGVHFTRMKKGGVEAGPNAVFAFKREGYKKTDFSFSDMWDSLSWPGFQKVMFKYTSMGIGEYYRSFNKAAFTKALQRLIPEITQDDLVPGGAGIRAQACDRNGKLIDDFFFAETDRAINVLNAPSPAATASLSIGETIAKKVVARF